MEQLGTGTRGLAPLSWVTPLRHFLRPMEGQVGSHSPRYHRQPGCPNGRKGKVSFGPPYSRVQLDTKFPSAQGSGRGPMEREEQNGKETPSPRLWRSVQ